MPDEDSAQRHTIHIRIRDLRRERSLTQEELAAALGLSRQSINAMEAGRNLPSLPVAMQIASFFAVPVHAIFDVPHDEPALAPWSPLREMRDAFDDMMQENANWAPVQSQPPVNISHTAQAVTAELSVPGYAKDEIAIEVGDDFLTVSSDAEDETDPIFRREFARQPFARTVPLPVPVKSSEAEATMRNGLLTITIPRFIEEKPRTARISIKSDE